MKTHVVRVVENKGGLSKKIFGKPGTLYKIINEVVIDKQGVRWVGIHSAAFWCDMFKTQDEFQTLFEIVDLNIEDYIQAIKYDTSLNDKKEVVDIVLINSSYDNAELLVEMLYTKCNALQRNYLIAYFNMMKGEQVL